MTMFHSREGFKMTSNLLNLLSARAGTPNKSKELLGALSDARPLAQMILPAILKTFSIITKRYETQTEGLEMVRISCFLNDTRYFVLQILQIRLEQSITSTLFDFSILLLSVIDVFIPLLSINQLKLVLTVTIILYLLLTVFVRIEVLLTC